LWGIACNTQYPSAGTSRALVQHAKLNAQQRQEAARIYGDAAMKLLHEAASKGYKNVAHMKKDTDLDPLRAREDFKQLVAGLERVKQTEKAKP
jgi:hypothetical protein